MSESLIPPVHAPGHGLDGGREDVGGEAVGRHRKGTSAGDVIKLTGNESDPFHFTLLDLPQDVDLLLERLHPLVLDTKWDTRLAAVQAIGEILKEVDAKDVAAEEEDDDVIKTEEKEEREEKLLDFDSFSALQEEGLSASRGGEFDDDDDSGRSAADQRRDINKTLGLDVMMAGNGGGGADIITDEDVAKLSSRERNRLKRSKQAAASASKKQKTAEIVGRRRRRPLYKSDRSRMSSGVWFLRDFCSELKAGLTDEQWETRHGSATALREVVRWQGRDAASGPLLLSQKDADAKKRAAWLTDLVVRLVQVIARDRFGDFVSDQVVAPVRESSAQALGAVVDLMPPEDVLRTTDILLSLLESKEWQCRHGGLLGVSAGFVVMSSSRSSFRCCR